MDEQFCDVGGGIRLCYETFGDADAPPLLLVMGLGTQMIGWHEDFCAQLADRGFHVIRFDNRDIGRSTHIDALPPRVGQLLRRDRNAAAYSLADMANDGVALLERLGASPAHIVGASMGGMIAQTMAARRPEAVKSLTSIMSNTGSRVSGQPSLKLWPFLLKPAPADRESYVEHVIRTFTAIGSVGFDIDVEHLRSIGERSFDRDSDRAGSGRQLAAIIAAGNRTAELALITAPTLVIHGTADKLVAPSGGRATARAVPGARLMRVPGMGHDLPRGAWPQIIDAIVENATRGGFQAPARTVAAAA